MEKFVSLFTLRNFATFLLVLFCIQYIPIESRAGVSVVKVAAMWICPIVLLWKTPNISKAGILVMLYFFCALSSALFHYATFRASTLIYMLSYLMLFWTFYNLVTIERVFSIQYFIKLVKNLIIAYTIVLVIQQIFLLAGVKLFAPINLCQIINRGIGANSLSFEPSSSARIMAVLCYAYLKCNEYLRGEALAVSELFHGEHKRVILCFLWSMLTMGSGIAFVCLAVLSLYFVQRRYLLYIVPVFFIVYMLLPYSNNKSLQRVLKVVDATMTLDPEEIRRTDSSAAIRVNPMVNTLKLDLTDIETWFGHGVDHGHRIGGGLSSEIVVGEIGDYGLIVYILGLMLVFSCSIKILSIPTIMYFIGIGGGTANIAYLWGILMVFLCVRYFSKNREYEQA